MTAIAASYHDRVNVLQGMAPKDASPFDRPEWYALLAEAKPPLLAMASDGDKKAALALTRANGRLEPLNHWYSFTWRQLAPRDAGGDRLLASLATDLKTHTARVTLSPVPDEDGSASRLETAFRTAGWIVHREQCDENHILPVRGRTFAEYWAERPGRMRTTLKRKAKKVDVELLTRFDGAAWAAYEEIYAHSWKPAEDTPSILRAFAQAEGEAGRIRLAIARHAGRPVAAQFWTVENGIAYIHKLAHLEETSNLSAGTTLSAALFEHVIDIDGVHLVDFGTGNDRYKADWMEKVRPRFLLDCLDSRQPRAWPPLIKRSVRQILTRLAPSGAES